MSQTIFRIDVGYRTTDFFNTAVSHMSYDSDRVGIAADQQEKLLLYKEDKLGYIDEFIPHCTFLREKVFFLQGDLSQNEVEQLIHELLADPVTETFTVTTIDSNNTTLAKPPQPATPELESSPSHMLDITLLPGVTDPAAENLLRFAHILGITTLEQVATGERYLIWGEVAQQELEKLAQEVFSNPVIQRYAIDQAITPPFVAYQQTDDTVEIVPLREADDDALLDISRTRRLALDLNEMLAIRTYYQQEQRDPTDAELETLAQTWSEHCVHKTFRAVIEFEQEGYDPVTIDGLLKTYIRGATEQLERSWIHSAFVDNAGIVAFDHAWDLAFKVETHNHPSALEPFGGANTGVGGVVRDILGVSARPIANTDVLCFGPPDLTDKEVPTGVLHPRRIAEGVISGVEDYGNKMGIPTVNGAILYHPGYTSNPLVYCGCLGFLPHGSHPTEPQQGDLIVVIGGRTGRDGLRGATFSSMEMDETTSDIAGSAVQIGHPIHEKQVQEVILQARDEKLYNAITDCGAGGLASAVGEMGRQLGASVQLEHVPLKYPGLRPWEIWLSEAQERMVLAVPPEHWERVQTLSEGQNIEAVCIGSFGNDGQLHLTYDGKRVGDLSMHFLHEGIPQRQLKAIWNPPQHSTSDQRDLPDTPLIKDMTHTLLSLLAHPNIRSKEDVVRRYDHEVQGGTIGKPMIGVADHGPGDATVLVPFDIQQQATPSNDSPQPIGNRAVALSVGVCPAYGEQDPYAMAWAAIDEAMRNVVAVGTDPDQVALLDNFCWGNPNIPDRLGSLVRCVQGCYDAAVAYQAPFISGKDSLNNEYSDAEGQKHAIPGTLLISALGMVPDVFRTISMDLKEADNLIYVIGDTYAELGGSHYAMLLDSDQSLPSSYQQVPQPLQNPLERYRSLHQAIVNGTVRSCHDCSEGGIGVALAEMCLAGRLGANIDLSLVPTPAEHLADDVLLFAESAGRFLVEVRPSEATIFADIMGEVPFMCIGRVTAPPADMQREPVMTVQGHDGKILVDVEVGALETAWRGKIAVSEPVDQQATQYMYLTSLATDAPSAPQSSHPPDHKPRVLILHANGTNRDRDAVLACQVAGGDPEIVHINQLLSGERRLTDYHMLVLPGGFSYGDDLGAGTLWAMDIRQRLQKDVGDFVTSGRPVLGICNGFQTLLKSGLITGDIVYEAQGVPVSRIATLAPNERQHFECRWVYLRANPHSSCLFTQGLNHFIYCPVAHGEGRFMPYDEGALALIQSENLVALSYVDEYGVPSGYPTNPNGSVAGIAGLCNRAGNVLGLMPHPEDHIYPWQHPRWHRGGYGMMGLDLFKNGVNAT